MGQTKSLTVPGRYTEIQRLCQFVGDGARHAGFDEDEIFRVQLACDEACTNIIEHTYGDEDVGKITVHWQTGSRYFIIVIEDSGQRFDPSVIPPAPVPPDPEDEGDIQVGGLGVYFMRNLMDDISFSFQEGSGNRLTMKKRLPDGKER